MNTPSRSMTLRSGLAITLVALSTRFVNSTPIFGIGQTESHAAVTALTTEETNVFIKPARFSQVAYCSSKVVLSWKCGSPCDALPGIEPITAGGDDGEIPLYFIAHDPTAQSIVLARRGTDPANIESDLNDIKADLHDIDTTLFPNAGSGIKTHQGFAEAFARTANQILGNVTTALKSKGVNKVEIHGHSLGAAISVMDAVFLRRHLDPSVSISTTVFGLPRGGNQAWADFVDKTIPGLVHIHNKNDPAGIVPPRIADYQHPSGEVHIQADHTSLNCPGQENQNSKCLAGQSLFDSSVTDHFGPYYDNISLDKNDCPL